MALTVPVSVAEVDVTFDAEPVVTVGGCAVVAVYVIVMVSVFVFPAPSFPVTVMTLSPLDRLMLDIDQLAVPEAVPLPPLLLLHDTSLMPLVLSDALPLKVIVLLVAVYVVLVVGLVMDTVGTVVSSVMVSLAVLETLPAASLYHA